MNDIILLQDDEEKRLFDFNEALDFFKRQEIAQSWTRNFLREGKVSPLDNAPLFTKEIRDKFAVSNDVSDDTLNYEMAGRKLLFSFPMDGKKRVAIPVGPSAYSSLLQRAGYGSSPVLSLLKDRTTQDEMSPTIKSMVLNAGLQCYKTKMLVLVRDQKVRAVLSGDESDYAIFNMSDVLIALDEELKKFCPNAFYRTGTASHEYETAVYDLNDETLSKSIEETFRKVGIDASGYRPMIKLGTSDVGSSAVTLTPVIVNKLGVEKYIGEPIKLTHNNKHNMGDFKSNVEKVFSSFRGVEEKISKLANVEIKYPAGCLTAIAAKLKFPKKQVIIAANEFGAFYTKARGTDVFWRLYDFLDQYATETDMNEFRKMNLSEGIIRITTVMSDYDYPFVWE